jgi:GntR family phosphonate transport system transcriptional regulator
MRSAGVVIWQKIAELLAAEIASGSLMPGERLPPEAVLAQRFGVNRHTLRRAMGSLAESGLVSVQHGRGSFVRPVAVVDYPVGSRTRFSEVISGQSRSPEGELLGSRELPSSPEISAALELDADAPVILLEILRRVDGVPLSVVSAHVPAERFRGIDKAFRDSLSITAALRAFGVLDYRRRSTRIWTRLPSAEDAVLLRQPSTMPVLVMEAVNEDVEGRPVEYGISRASGQRLQVVVTH